MTTVQLTTSQFMELPDPEGIVPVIKVALFRLHRLSGITVLTLLALHWIWGLAGHAAGGWGNLFPWFSRERRGNVISDLKSMPSLLRGALPGQNYRGTAIAGAVHGLGLLTATGMGLTGSILFFGIKSDGTMNASASPVVEIHQFIANFLWAFIVGHVGMAILHQWQGDKVLTRMFNLAQK
jgi:cytochrome b561